MQRGDVWWYESPATSRRACVVMTRSAAIPVMQRVVVVPITRTRREIPTEIALDVDDGLPGPCVATADNIEVVSKAMLTIRIATLSEAQIRQLCEAVNTAIGC